METSDASSQRGATARPRSQVVRPIEARPPSQAPWRVEGRVAGAAGFVPARVVESVAAPEGVDGDEEAVRAGEGETLAGDASSWVDAVVTLLAIVIFGLGWALFELESADRAAADAMKDYDRSRAEIELAALSGIAPGAFTVAVEAADAPGAHAAVWMEDAESTWPGNPIAPSLASSTR